MQKNCLICAETAERPSNAKDAFPELLQERPEDPDKLFSLLCKSLKIKLSKKNSWDFEKEPLPLCPSCLDIGRGLVQIQENIKLLETQFVAKVEELRNLIFAIGEYEYQNKPDKEHHPHQLQQDERFIHFRRQVTGGARKPSLREPVKNTPSVSVPPKLRLKNLSVLMPEARRRRSSRVTKRIHTILPQQSTSDFQDGETDKDHFHTGQDSDDEVEDYNNEASDIDTTELKPYVEIKEEAESDELEEAPNVLKPVKLLAVEHTKAKVKASVTKINPKRRAKSKTMPRILRNKKPRKYSSDEESEEGSDYKPKKSIGIFGITESDQDSSDYDEEKSRWATVRKWRADGKSGKLWYDGIEVISLDNGLKCSRCDEVIIGDKKSNNKIKMKRHILLKHLEKFTCVLCDKIMSCKKYLDMHVKMVHEKSIIIPCEVCEKPFTSINAMKRHAWNHQNEEEKEAAIASGKKQYGGGRKSQSMQCGQCGKMCKGPYNLKRHEETHIDHSERLKHMCQICGALYSAPETLRSHIKMAHENNNQLQWLQCPHCPKKYPQPGRLEKHMRCHTGEKPHKCPECGTGFSQSTLLKVHMLKHKNLRPHKCDHCDMSFFRRYHLQRHTQVYHESKTPPTKKQPYRSENGTRKTPQKRTRKKMSTFDLEKPQHIEQLLNPSHQLQLQPQPICNTVDAQQLLGIVGNMAEAPPQPFNFTSSTSCAYPFSYSFTGGGGGGLNQ